MTSSEARNSATEKGAVPGDVARCTGMASRWTMPSTRSVRSAAGATLAVPSMPRENHASAATAIEAAA
jgi:hypothetical protein